MTIDQITLVASATIVLAAAAIRFCVASGTPSMLIFLGIGVLLGQGGLAEVLNYDLVAHLSYLALALILAEGGLTAQWREIRPAVAPAAVLATLGTLVCIGAASAVAHFVAGIAWTNALLLAAVVSSTDAGAVFSVLRSVPIPRRMVGLLEAEAGFNDAPVVILVVALTQTASLGGDVDWLTLGVSAVGQLFGGVVLGLLMGWFVLIFLRVLALPAAGLYPIAILSACLMAYAVGSLAGVSGFIAVYVCGVVAGNSHLPHRHAVSGFAEAVGWLAQIGLFVLLGTLVRPEILWGQLPSAVMIGLVLLFVGRPLSVVISLTPWRFSVREQLVVSWAGLRGAVPIALATIPMSAQVPGSENLYEKVFLLVIVFIVVQGMTLPWVVRRARLASNVTRDLDIDASPLNRIGADLMEVEVGPGSRLAGVMVRELRLPASATVSVVMRDERVFQAGPATTLRPGDTVMVVVPQSERESVVRRLEQVSAVGRLAGWHRGSGSGLGRFGRDAKRKTEESAGDG